MRTQRQHSRKEYRAMTQISGWSGRQWCRGPVFSLAVAALVLGANPALAEDAVKGAPSGALGPLELVRSSVARVMAIVQSPDGGQRRAEVRQEAEALFDFNEMGRRTLAQHWTCLLYTSDAA